MKLKDNLFFRNLPIFYINLDRNKERNEYIVESFKKNNIDLYFRVSAVDGSKLEKSYDDYNLSQPEAALFFSFKKALQMFLETDYEYAAIAEDDLDLSISKNIMFNFYDTLRYHNPSLYALQCSPLIQDASQLSLKIKKRNPTKFEVLWGNALMIVNRPFAKKILNEVFYDEDFHPCGPSHWQQQADYCIYNHAEAYVWTVFKVKHFPSSISENNSEIIQRSIENIDSFINKKVYLHDVL